MNAIKMKEKKVKGLKEGPGLGSTRFDPKMAI